MTIGCASGLVQLSELESNKVHNGRFFEGKLWVVIDGVKYECRYSLNNQVGFILSTGDQGIAILKNENGGGKNIL